MLPNQQSGTISRQVEVQRLADTHTLIAIVLGFQACLVTNISTVCVCMCDVYLLQVTQNLLDTKTDTFVALPPGDIRPPCKLIDRTHHVTEKVTQVGKMKPRPALL